MITADKARKIKLNVFSKLRYIIYLFLLNLYIKKNASKGKYTLLFNEYFLLRVFYRKWDIKNISVILKRNGYQVFLNGEKRGITWE